MQYQRRPIIGITDYQNTAGCQKRQAIQSIKNDRLSNHLPHRNQLRPLRKHTKERTQKKTKRQNKIKKNKIKNKKYQGTQTSLSFERKGVKKGVI
jgi:hypothetical protein